MSRRRSPRKPEIPEIPPIYPGDRVVVVVGPTGAGKGTFIACAANLPENHPIIGHDQRSHTLECQAIRRDHSSSRRSTVLIDTPGFNSTDGDDTVVLAKIGDFLTETCKRSRTVPIFVYLHNMQDNRVPGSVMKSLDHLRLISSQGMTSNVVFATTFWSYLREKIGTQREQELWNIYWRDMLAMGCKYNRFDDNHDSAWKIINKIPVQDSPEVANDMTRRFSEAKAREQQKIDLEETKKRSFMSKFLGFFKFGKK